MPDKFSNRFITRQTARQAGETAIVLETIAFEARAPFGGFVWNRPVAVVTRGAITQGAVTQGAVTQGAVTQGAIGRGPAIETRLPIIDLTRRGQVVLYSIALFFMLAGLAARGRAHQE